MNNELLAPNPATLASGVAQELVIHKHYHPELPVNNEHILAILEDTADDLDFLNEGYWVEANRCLSLPADVEPDQDVHVFDFHAVALRGDFITYSTLEIGKIIGGRVIDALCLAFTDAMIYPTQSLEGYHLPDDHLLHVPVLAVKSIDQAD